MDLAWISIAAFTVVIILSCVTSINVGVLAMSMALVVGVFVGGMEPNSVLEGFPVPLLVTLIGVTLLFSIAECNGTLARLTSHAVRACRGRASLLPIVFFALAWALSTIGAGATPASALLAPPAMAVAARAGVPPLLMVVVAGNGALAGTLSPFAPTGIVSAGVMARIGLGGYEWYTFAYNALAHTIVGFGGFVLFGGLKLFKRPAPNVAAPEPDAGSMEPKHWLTTVGIMILIIAVAGLGMEVGMTALVVATLLILLRTVEEVQAIQRMPWGVLLMVTGVTVLISMLEATKGLELITEGMAQVSTRESIAPIVAFGTGVVSVYSSTSGVVLPAFLPLVPDLAERLGGLDPLRIAFSMNVGASLVDLSSLSTIGALFLAAAAPGTDVRAMFNRLLAWGLSMSLVAALLCWLFFSQA